MQFIGELIKKQRLSKKISLEEASDELKISKDILKKIENDEIIQDISPVFLLGHIRSYANFLDLNSIDIINQYKIQNDVKVIKANTISKPNVYIHTSVLKNISPLFFILIIFSTFYFLFIDVEKTSREYAIIPDLPENLIPIIEKAEIELSKSTKQNELDKNKLIEIERKITSSSVIASSKISKKTNDNKLITLKLLNPTWIQLRDVNDNIIISKLMSKNEEYSYNLDLQYSLTIGNAGNVLVFIDNVSRGKIGESGQIVDSFIIDNRFNN